MRKGAAIVAGVVVLAVLAAWLIYLPSVVVHAVRIPADTTPAAFDIGFSDVSFPTRGGGPTLRGWWMEARDPKGVVIFVHGGNGNRRDIYAGGLEMQAFLVGQGYSVLAFDQRNHGRSDATADGQITLGIEESRDALGAVDYVAKRAPGRKITLLADSMGGATAIYAATKDRRIAGLMLIDPALDADSVELGALYANIGLPQILLPPIAWSAKTFFAHPTEARDALKEGERLAVPILLIQDDRDPVCRPEFSRALAAANRHVTLWISRDPDAPAGRWGYHTGAWKLHRAEVAQQMLRFLAGGG
ncbi:MAG: alpha/beta hydrolase [Rhizomicrobium sp.]